MFDVFVVMLDKDNIIFEIRIVIYDFCCCDDELVVIMVINDPVVVLLGVRWIRYLNIC